MHHIEYTPDGARCTCGLEWSVWTCRKRAYFRACDADRYRSLLRATADRHARQRKEAAP